MNKSRTATVKDSENKAIIQRNSYEDLMIVYEELEVLDSALRGLWATTIGTQDERLKSDNFKWLIEMGIGKASQRVDMTSKGEKIVAGIFIEGLDDDKDV